MALKDFDYKQFLLDKGERVGLYAAAGLAVLFIGLSLFWPGKGLFSASPAANAKAIQDVAKVKSSEANSNKEPDDNDRDTLRKVDPQLLKQASNIALDPAALRLLTELFAPREIPSNKRQNPNILPPEDFAFDVVPAQISTYMFQPGQDGRRVGILVAGDSLRRNTGRDPLSRIKNVVNGPGGARPPGAPGGSFLPGFGSGKERGSMSGGPMMGEKPGGGDAFTSGNDKKAAQLKYVQEKELADQKVVYARDLFAKQMAIVAGAFPLKAQVTEFQNALRLDNPLAVFNEKIKGKDNKEKAGFRFLGFDVQRRAYGPDSKPVVPENDGWQNLDLASQDSPYVDIVEHGVVKEFTPENPKLEKLLWPNMYLPRPVQISTKSESNDPKDSKPYKDIELSLPKIEHTLAKLTPEQKTVVPKSKFEDGGNFRPFEQEEEVKVETNTDTSTAKDSSIPEYCLVRFIDVTVKAGETYEYRIRVRMANPNYGKPESEVANKQLTEPLSLSSDWVLVRRTRYRLTDEGLAGLRGDGMIDADLTKVAELRNQDYPSETEYRAALAKVLDKQKIEKYEKYLLARAGYAVPLRISVPGDLHFYAVDQMALNLAGQEPYRGTNAKDKPDYSRQTVIQVHRWMQEHEVTQGKRTTFYPVGDWVVGERIFAFRGEYLAQKGMPTHLPVWSVEDNGFILAGNRTAKGGVRGDTRPTDDVTFFSDPKTTPFLLDFDGGMTPLYKHTGAAAAAKSPDDAGTDTPKTPVEVKPAPIGNELLLLTPDGKLVAHDGAADAENPDRVNRLNKYEKRVAEAEGKEAPPAKPMK